VIDSIRVKDVLGNELTLPTSALDAAGYPTAIEITGVGDVTVPVVTSLSAESALVGDASAGPVTYSFLVHATDDLSGVQSVYLVLDAGPNNAPSQNYFASGSRISGTALDGVYRVSFTFPRYSVPGTRVIDSIRVKDVLGNELTLPTSALDAAGYPTAIAVTGNSASATFPAGGGFLSTGSDASPADPLKTSVVVPTAGSVTIAETTTSVGAPAGLVFGTRQVNVSAPASTPALPLQLAFTLDSSLLTQLGATPASVVIFRDSVPLTECSDPSQVVASPDPCIFNRVPLAGGDALVQVYSSHASRWNFARRPARPIITTTVVPSARLGASYATGLAFVGGKEPVRWKKASKLPKGLKLNAKTGLISGNPKGQTGSFKFTVQVMDRAKPKNITSKTLSITVY
jgi:hypothetical protein